jgi:hypothetical protein
MCKNTWRPIIMPENLSEVLMGGLILIYSAWQVIGKIKIKFPTTRIDYTYHSFFKIMDNAILYLIPAICITGQPEKTMICKIYASVKLQVIKDDMYKLALAFKKSKGAHCSSEKEMLTALDASIKEYRKKAVFEISKVFNKKVAKLFDEKFTIQVHQGCIITTRNAVSGICRSNFYRSCSDKFSAILDIYAFALQHTVIDLEKTCELLNGEIEKALGQKHGCQQQAYITKEEFEMSERVQNAQLKEILERSKNR